ncbi:unnamed protein product [Cyprideis torosa]|uniref:Uncharacterized protein n=1 Tax=Cyprideis torosa TaxID=163714 RepID=A0A7R8WIY3_9CRUS|nr:unnamed protein product [Cyprideis torosa]CAG0895166.1 unnamed protein product [Cyprideis torosa]
MILVDNVVVQYGISYLIHFLNGTLRFLINLFPSIAKKIVYFIFGRQGIRFNGKNRWDIQVHNTKLIERMASDTGLGFGEAYMEGWWDCDDLEELFYRWASGPNGCYMPLTDRFRYRLQHLMNRQNESLSKTVAICHYDLGNDLYTAFLDKTMNYTCAYWRKADNLDQAQIDKMELTARKLKLKPGMKVLDLGCGFGSMAKYLAENYQVEVVAYNISTQQVNYAREICAGLPVEIRHEDYRKAEGLYDRVYSIGLLEHVGVKNYRTYFEVAERCLKDDGIMLTHAITLMHPTQPSTERWVDTYIFPNGWLPWETDFITYSKGLFVVEDLHNFGYDYYKTLMAWHQNFEKNWPTLEQKYGQKFYRMWRFYLLGAAGHFRARKFHLLQVVYSKMGLEPGYESER